MHTVVSTFDQTFFVFNPEYYQEIFHQAFARYGDGLYYYVLKLTRDEEKARDIIQECFLRLWENITTIDTNADLKPLLITYIRNLLTDDFRKSQKHLLAAAFLEKEEAILPEIELRLLTQDRQRQLSASLKHFPEKRQHIIQLVRQGLSYSEVAQQLGLSLPDVKKQMRISLQVLRKTLQFFFSLGGLLLSVLP